MTDEPSSHDAIRLVAGLRELASSYDVIFCDVWGVVHDGRAAFKHACDALRRFRADGGVVVLLTNSPRPRKPIFAQLARLGVPADAFDALVTSGDVTLSFMAARAHAPVCHIGPPRDLALFDALKEESGFAPPRAALEEADYVLCTGLDDDDETPDDYADALATMRARGLDFVCANPDLVVHVGDRLVYCAGALAARYESLGGLVLQAGKPHAPIYERARREAAAAATGKSVDGRRILAIGDAMRTDIRGACDAGLDALFVTSGIHRDELHRDELHRAGAGALDEAAFAQFFADAGCRPTAAIARLAW